MKKFNFDLLVATGIFPPDIGGPATYSKLLLEELSREGFRVKVLSFGSVRPWPKVVRHFIYTCLVWRFGRQAKVIYAQDPVSVGLPVMLACGLLNRSFVLKIVGDYAWEQGSQRFGVHDFLDDFSVKTKPYVWPVKVLKKIQVSVAKKADQIIVPSNYLKKIVSNWGIDPDKIKVIYNAFDEPIALGTKADLRNNLKLSGQIITSVGRLVPWKGFALLIEIISGLTSTYPELKLYIIGEGPDQEMLYDLIFKNKMQEKIFLLGRLPQADLLQFLKASDIFVLNTSYEGFSHQLLEVMWCGTPIITTAVGGNVELIEDGKNGLLTPFSDRQKLETDIKAILDQPEYGRELAAKAKLTLLTFSLDKMIGELRRHILW